MRNRLWIVLLATACASQAAKKTKTQESTPLDRYVAEANARGAAADARSSGSIWQPGALLSDMARDLRASQVDDLVTIVVAESASAVSTGTTKSARQSSAKYAVTSIKGPTTATGPLANLLNTTGNQSLDGQATTTRGSTLTTTVSARVVGVLPNGYLVLEGTKNIAVNSENQVVTVRGVARPADLTSSNTVSSTQLAQLEVRINGKGVVNDAIRRPMFLYRLLLGILPF